MKDLYHLKQPGFVDLFVNDIYGLEKAKKVIKRDEASETSDSVQIYTSYLF